MDGNYVAALLTAAGGLLVGLVAGYRGIRSDKFSRDVQTSAALLSGYTGMVEQLREEVARVKEQTAREMAEQDERHDRDRRQWDAERKALQAEVRELRARVYELIDISRRPDTKRTRAEDGEGS